MTKEQRPPAPGETIVPQVSRARFRHPLRGTALARSGRGAVRWARATLHARRHNARLGAAARTLNFFPGRPQTKAQMTAVVGRLGLRIGFLPGAPDATMAWDSGAWFDPRAADRLPADALNGRCLDVSKSTVDRLWEELAGYGVTVDPQVTEGPIVIKSELNGVHDGRVVMGPLPERQPGLVYQRLIDGRRDGQIYATRVAIVGDAMPIAFEKRRPHPNWFHGGSVVTPARAEDLYSTEEVELIRRFAQQIGMDYGEIDVLRETASGRIYVIDANRTPIRPIGMAPEHDEPVLRALSDAFAALFDARTTRAASDSAA